MKLYLLTTVSSLALTGAVAAADMAAMPMQAPPPVAQVMTWTGPYIGINGGAVWHRATGTYDVITGGGISDSARTTSVGATFGGQLGYNQQIQNGVVGVEIDGNWVDASKSALGANPDVEVNFHNKLSWLATARLRLGLTIAPPTLLYVTGGLALGKIKNTANVDVIAVVNDEIKVGWTIGGGVEHILSRNWSVKVEALYVDLGKDTVKLPIDDSGYIGTFKNTAIIARAGVNLRW